MAYAILDGRNICCGLTENTNMLEEPITATVANIGQYWNGSAFVASPYEWAGNVLYDRNNTPGGAANLVAPVTGWYYVTAIGGGGGGGGGFVNGGAGSGGGPGSGVKNYPLFLQAGDTVDITIGAGGSPGAAGGATQVAVNSLIVVNVLGGAAGNAGTATNGGNGAYPQGIIWAGNVAGATTTPSNAPAVDISITSNWNFDGGVSYQSQWRTKVHGGEIIPTCCSGGGALFISASSINYVASRMLLPSGETYGNVSKAGGAGGVTWYRRYSAAMLSLATVGANAQNPTLFNYCYGCGGQGGDTDTAAAYTGSAGAGGMVAICY